MGTGFNPKEPTADESVGRGIVIAIAIEWAASIQALITAAEVELPDDTEDLLDEDFLRRNSSIMKFSTS